MYQIYVKSIATLSPQTSTIPENRNALEIIVGLYLQECNIRRILTDCIEAQPYCIQAHKDVHWHQWHSSNS